MDNVFKIVAAVFIAVVLHQLLSRRDKDIALLLSIVVCCMVLLCAIRYLQPVTEFFDTLQRFGNMERNVLSILLKCTGIGLLAEMTSLICKDAGNSAMGKALEILAAAVILWLSLPLFTALIELAEEIMGEV